MIPLKVAVAVVILAAALCRSADAAAELSDGTFALASAKQHTSARLAITRVGQLTARFDVSESRGGRVVRFFDIDMTQRMHMIVIGDDFSSFEYLHPRQGSDGHFRLDVTVPRRGRYYAYVDAVPHGLEQQVFRFTVAFGNASARPPKLAGASRIAGAGAYRVKLSGLRLRAHTASNLTATIAKGAAPASDLRPYLGGAAHAVFVNVKSLDYLHVHPSSNDSSAGGSLTSMPGMGRMQELRDDAAVAPTMRFVIEAPSAGTYELWLQFRARDGLHVARFTLVAG